MKTYERYKDARNTAWKILIKLKLITFPLKLTDICKKLKVTLLISENTLKNKEACAIFSEKKPIIIYNPGTYFSRLRFSIAHELGHIVLKHFNPDIIRDDFTESEANIFARCLLMPAIVCHIEKLFSVAQIQAFFNVSKQAAEIRLKRILDLEKRNAWNYSKLEKRYGQIYYKS